ncbi:class I SAM-dependent methyltransferase [Trinickia caryophylli]|nr:class I SAM-dependent methyltransferase [Trinickia caryophylli]
MPWTDAAEGLLAQAAADFPSLVFRRAELPALDAIPNDSFDNVPCGTVVMHLPPDEITQACRRLYEILKPKGMLRKRRTNVCARAADAYEVPGLLQRPRFSRAYSARSAIFYALCITRYSRAARANYLHCSPSIRARSAQIPTRPVAPSWAIVDRSRMAAAQATRQRVPGSSPDRTAPSIRARP